MSIVVGVGVPGLAGLNVTCRPMSSTAVHWVADGHATPSRLLAVSIVVGVGVPGLAGLNVTCRPLPSTAVHWVAVGHATPSRLLGVDRGGGRGARAGRVERDLLPAAVDGGALGGGRARHPRQGLLAVAVVVDRGRRRPRQLRQRRRRQPARHSAQRAQHEQRSPDSDRHTRTSNPRDHRSQPPLFDTRTGPGPRLRTSHHLNQHEPSQRVSGDAGNVLGTV